MNKKETSQMNTESRALRVAWEEINTLMDELTHKHKTMKRIAGEKARDFLKDKSEKNLKNAEIFEAKLEMCREFLLKIYDVAIRIHKEKDRTDWRYVDTKKMFEIENPGR